MNKETGRAVCCLAVDIGAESGRVIQGSFNGNEISLEEKHRFSNGPVRVGDHLHIDILNIWNQIQTGLTKSIQDSQGLIKSVGVDTWGVDFTLLDKNGSLLASPYHYRDRRTDGVLEKMFSIVPRERIYQQTGSQFMQFNTLVQLYAMRLQEPHVLDNADALLMLPDLLHYWLCGQKANEFCVATTTQCFDQLTGSWAEDLLREYQIPGHIFQDISRPGTVLGEVAPWLLLDGEREDISVILPASHDTASAVTAVPVVHDDFLYISSGTWSLVGTELDKPEITVESLQKNLTNEGNPGGKTRFLKVVPGMWMLHQCKLEWKNKGNDYSYSDLTDLATNAKDCGAVIDVTAPEFLDPGNMVYRIQDFCFRSGQSIPHTEGEIIYCILKSLSCLYRSLLDDFEGVLKKRLNVIHIIGGGSRNTLLNQLTANMTNRPVIAGPVEATAAGNVLVQVMGLGYLSSLEDIRCVVRNSFNPIRFEPVQSAKWEEDYLYYQEILNKIKYDS